jgi:AcrR family transcriptional regulator
VELGIEVFSRRAYDEVSIDDVAAQAGISKGLLYHYFATKRDFYVETVREVAARLLRSTAPDPSQPPAMQLEAGLRAYLEFARRHGPVYASLMRGGVGADREVTRVMERTREALVDRITDAVRGLPGGRTSPGPGPGPGPGPLLRLAMRGWIGFVESTCLEWIVKREPAPEQLLALWVSLLMELLPKVVPGLQTV